MVSVEIAFKGARQDAVAGRRGNRGNCGDRARIEPAERTQNLLIPAGATLQDVLRDSLDLAIEDVEATVEGRSASRLDPLLPGERIRIVRSQTQRDDETRADASG